MRCVELFSLNLGLLLMRIPQQAEHTRYSIRAPVCACPLKAANTHYATRK